MLGKSFPIENRKTGSYCGLVEITGGQTDQKTQPDGKNKSTWGAMYITSTIKSNYRQGKAWEQSNIKWDKTIIDACINKKRDYRQ